MKKITLALVSCLFLFSLLGKEQTLQILLTTDTHGKFLPFNYETAKPDFSGSLAQIQTEVKKLRNEYPNNTILVDNGDSSQGNSLNIFIDKDISPMIIAMNYMGYDLINIGNHEFNYGVPKLIKIMSTFKAKDGNPNSVLCGNLYDKNGKRLFAPYKIVKTKDGLKVGFIGMVTPNITRWDGPNLKDYKVTNPIDETRKAIAELKGKVDLIVAIDHMGLENEYGVQGSGVLDIAKNFPEIKVILSGHAHKSIPGVYYYKGKTYDKTKATKEIKENGTLIIQAPDQCKALGQVIIKLDKTDKTAKILSRNSNLIPMEEKINGKKTHVSPDKKLSQILEPYNKEAIDYGKQVIGKLIGNNPLIPSDNIKGIPQGLLEPTPAINLINQTLLYYANKTLGENKVKVAASSLLNIYGNIEPGPIKRSDVTLIYKYPNTPVVLKMTGKQLKTWMEQSASIFNEYHKGDLSISFNPKVRSYQFCTFSGLNYNIDISQPAGKRIKNLKWPNGKTVSNDESFLTVTNNYFASSILLVPGTLYKTFKECPKLVSDDISVNGDNNIQTLLKDYVGNINNGKIKADTKQNWKIIGNNWNKKEHQKLIELVSKGKITIDSKGDRALVSKPITEKELNALK